MQSAPFFWATLEDKSIMALAFFNWVNIIKHIRKVEKEFV